MTELGEISQASRVRLVPHPTARNAAVSTSVIPSGSVIASIPCLSTSLLPTEKGKRCDVCHVVQSDDLKLRRCSGCASFWYCGTACQTNAWKAHHKKLCRNFNAFTASMGYQALTPHDQVDAVLLSQMVAEPASWAVSDNPDASQKPHATFLDLLRSPRGDGFELPLCLPKGTDAAEALSLAKELYSRFGNNNFILHSHLNAYGHGVFPLASRLFNHSCVPNAACKYVLRPSEAVTMQVVALRDIPEGDEVTIPYLDPALPYQTRQDALQTNYGFVCECQLCTFQAGMQPVRPPPVRGSGDFREFEAALRAFALGVDTQSIQVPTSPGLFKDIPPRLYPVFHESYLPALSELFSKTSHEGTYVDAIEAGLTLFALYVAVYPPNYPQIGMHALELSKTIWNFICTAGSALPARESDVLERQTERFLGVAENVLMNFGPDGDEGGPLEEVRILREALGLK